MEEEISKKPVTPLSEFDCQSFPLIEGNTYEISEEELEKLGKHELKWSTEEYEEDGETKTRPILIPNDPTEENARNEANRVIAELKAKLAKTDYQAIKFAEGELSEKEYAPIREDRKAWRAEINKQEKIIEGEK